MSIRASYRIVFAPISTFMAALALTLPAQAAGAAPALELRDGGKASVSLADARPGDSATGCVILTYRGEESARVRLFGATSGTGFDRYLDLRVDRGKSCASFRPVDVAYEGTLEGFPDSLRTAIDESWRANETRAYRFHVQVQDDESAQGLTARQTFTWVATGESDKPAPSQPGATAPPAMTGGGLIPVPPSPQGLRELLEKIAKVAVEVGKRSAFPSSLLMLVLGFLSVQNRIDRRDPKLALAPVYPTPELPFSPPAEGGDDE